MKTPKEWIKESRDSDLPEMAYGLFNEKDIREIQADALRDANELCRSAYQVALRDGKTTNWRAFRKSLIISLDRQYAVMYPKGAVITTVPKAFTK